MKTLSPTIANFNFEEHLMHLAEKLGWGDNGNNKEETRNTYDRYVRWVEKNVDSMSNQAA